MDYYVDTQKGNTAHSVLKSSLPVPVFAAKIKTQNLDSSKVIQEDINNLELDIVFANKFCRQAFNIKKKMDMKDKLKYLFLQGELNNTSNNDINLDNNEHLKYYFDKVFEETEINCYSPEYRVAKKIQNNQKKQAYFNQQLLDQNLKLPNVQSESIQINQNNQIKPQNNPTFQINPIPITNNSNQLTNKQDNQESNMMQINLQDVKSQSNFFSQHRNSVKQKMMTQQFLKQNFTKQEIKEYGMASSQLTTILYYHILQKLYMNLFNRQRNDPPTTQNSPIKQERKTKQFPTSIKNLSPQASQIYEQQQEDLFLDVMYIDCEKKRRKFFDIKIIEIEWENEQALMVINQLKN